MFIARNQNVEFKQKHIPFSQIMQSFDTLQCYFVQMPIISSVCCVLCKKDKEIQKE